MPRLLLKIVLSVIVFLGIVILVLYAASHKPIPEKISYGMSFNTFYATELGLDPRETYDAIIDDLGVRNLRLAAHWPMIEPRKDVYDFEELDHQMARAEEVDAKVILAVGRRLPRWPECHVPGWAKEEDWEVQKDELRAYITAVVERYKDSDALMYWQVENEPFLEVFAFEHCGKLDKDFFEEEIKLVKELDPDHKILVTDSGNLGTWRHAYTAGDVFGTSMYVYLWNPELGRFKTILPPWFYRTKENIVQLLYGQKDTILIELAAEPWLIEPIVDVPIDVQYTRMDLEKINEIIAYAEASRYERQYLWGAEWWYWLHKQGDSVIWERGKELFKE